MKKVAIFYAPAEGQARKVAHHLTGALVARDLEVAVHHVRDPESEAALDLADAAIVVASVHGGEHDREAVEFVREQPQLHEIPASFVSVSPAEAEAESRALPLDEREAAARRVEAQLQHFLAQTHWYPAHVQPIAGAVHAHSNLVVRWVMKQIARAQHAIEPAEIDWRDVDALASQIAEELGATP